MGVYLKKKFLGPRAHRSRRYRPPKSFNPPKMLMFVPKKINVPESILLKYAMHPYLNSNALNSNLPAPQRTPQKPY